MAFPGDKADGCFDGTEDPLWQTEVEAKNEPIGDHFYYFGFGSNLLQERVRNGIKSAEYVGVGLLKVCCYSI